MLWMSKNGIQRLSALRGWALDVRLPKIVQKLMNDLQFKFITSAQLLQNCCCAFVQLDKSASIIT